MIRKVIGTILILATLALGAWFDIVVMLVGGFDEIVKGVNANPNNGSMIGWGIAHVVYSGIGMFVAFFLCFLWVGLFYLSGDTVSRINSTRRARRTYPGGTR